VAIGEVKTAWNEKKGAIVTRSEEWSYYSSADSIREFEDASLAEVHERGVENAEKVLAVNDGSLWIQSLTDYHCPDAIHILDFSHAAEHLATAGKAVLEEHSDRFQNWYREAAHRLKHQPPGQTLARLYLMHRQTADQSAQDTILQQIDYLERRRAQIDYPYFRARHYPIGSGSIESAHKHVVQKRMKQAGMRWADDNINPMLALRNLIANDRWHDGWDAITHSRWQNRRAAAFGRAIPPQVSEPITLDSLPTLPAPPPSIVSETVAPKRTIPAPGHPWRRGIWPDPRYS
jgi:hypothetical protein